MAFTVIDANTSWQELAIAQEIRTAYNKRRTACGLSLMDEPTEALTVSSFILAVQTGIEEMATQFANPSATLAGQTSLPANYATLAAFMTGAGLTALGYWRRIADGGTQPETWTNYGASGWSYGKIQDLDLAGPWQFQDIMTALAALTRRVPDSASPSQQAYASANFEDNGTITEDVIASGAISPSTGTPPEFSDALIHVEKYKYGGGGNFINRISLNFQSFKFSQEILGTPSAITFVGLIDASSTSAFTAFTGIAATEIGKTITRPSAGIVSGSAYGWLWDPPDVIDDHTWADISAALPSASVPTNGAAVRDFDISDWTCVIDYDFNP